MIKNVKKLTAIYFFVLIATTTFAQGIEISEAARSMNSGTYNSFLFELPDVTKKEAEADWKKFMSDFKAKTKYDRKTELWFADDAKMPRLSDNTIDVYASIIEDSNPKKGTTIIVWFDLGGAFVSSASSTEQGDYALDILSDYGMLTSKHHAEAIVKAEEKILSKLEGDLKKLRKDNDAYHKAIEKAKDTIAKMEKNIEINEQDQKTKEKEIDGQKKVVVGAKENVKQFN